MFAVKANDTAKAVANDTAKAADAKAGKYRTFSWKIKIATALSWSASTKQPAGKFNSFKDEEDVLSVSSGSDSPGREKTEAVGARLFSGAKSTGK